LQKPLKTRAAGNSKKQLGAKFNILYIFYRLRLSFLISYIFKSTIYNTMPDKPYWSRKGKKKTKWYDVHIMLASGGS